MIIKTDTDRAIEIGGKQIEFKSYGIGNVAVMQQVMRSSMYSNPIKAAMQEYISNARDAHRELGNPEVPTEVNFTINNEVEIRDFGIGISPERMEKHFASYFDSTKRMSQKETGGYGLGCKTAFADQDRDFFTVRSVYPRVMPDGTEQFWCHTTMHMISSVGETSWGEIGHHPNTTNEPRGTTISLPIKEEDAAEYIEALVEVTKHWEVRPVINASTDVHYPVYTEIHSGRGEDGKLRWELVSSGTCEAVVDGIPYPINSYMFSNDYQITLRRPFRFYFSTGEVDVVATRESIDYRSQTVVTIESRLREATEAIKSEIAKVVDAHESYWDARQAYLKLSEAVGDQDGMLSQFVSKFGAFHSEDLGYGHRGKLMACCNRDSPSGRWERVSRFEVPENKIAIIVVSHSSTLHEGRLATLLKEYPEDRFEVFVAVVPGVRSGIVSRRSVVSYLPMQHCAPKDRPNLADWKIDPEFKSVVTRKKAPRGTFFRWVEGSGWKRTEIDESPTSGLLVIIPDGYAPATYRSSPFGDKGTYAILAKQAIGLDLSGFTIDHEVIVARALKKVQKAKTIRMIPAVNLPIALHVLPRPMHQFSRTSMVHRFAKKDDSAVVFSSNVRLNDYFPFLDVINTSNVRLKESAVFVLRRMPWSTKSVWGFVNACKRDAEKVKKEAIADSLDILKDAVKALDDRYKLIQLPRTTKHFIAQYKKRHSLSR